MKYPCLRALIPAAVALLGLELGGAPAGAQTGFAGLLPRDPRTWAVFFESLGERYQYANEMALSEASFRQALEANEAAWGAESLQVARTLSRLGNVLRLQNRLDAAAQTQERALAIRQRLAPDSLEVTDSLHQLFLVAFDRRDAEAMAELVRRALAIQERWPSDTLAMADTLNDAGMLATEGGRYDEATAVYQRALAILEKRVPGSIPLATTLNRLALVARYLGDLDRAVELLQRALSIRERLAPESLGTAAILSNLGAIARERGDLARAEELFRRSLAIWAKAAPEGPGVAGALDALGIVARRRGNLDESWSLHSRALEIRKRFPSHLEASFTLGLLGMVAEARGDLKLALSLHRQAYELYEQRAPGMDWEAVPLQQLGRLYHLTGQPEAAAEMLGRAVDALEAQAGKLERSQEIQALFRARYEEIYGDAIAVALARGRAAEAFHLVERSRARSFLALLAERDLTFPGDLPPELERSRRNNASCYDKALRELARWGPAAGEAAREALRGELTRLRQERDEIAAGIRKASPRLAALRQPQPLDLEDARKVLDPGTLALSYSVGKDRTALFAITREGGLRVEILPVGEAGLRQDVERFLEQVRQPGGGDPSGSLARSLYRDLIGPVADLVERSERLLILPDGPLHRLPFGALVRAPGGAAPGRGQYLIEWKPLHTTLSLTVYGTLRAMTPASPGGQLVAFGDPRYPRSAAPAGQAPVRRALALRDVDWTPLPYSRREVERIAAAYPEARVYLGAEATEERAKSAVGDARVLHFATHGAIDDRSPLDSALVLSIPEDLPPGRDNGLLQVWEIFESVRLDADLVVLSACESALGRELSGEGMIGLTRAFQYAGARSVVASLWSVADQVTAELMARFHRHRAAGLPKDEALRAAQIELIRQPVRIATARGQEIEIDASSPFFWAAFQVFGDWR